MSLILLPGIVQTLVQKVKSGANWICAPDCPLPYIQGISVLPSYCVEKLNNADNLVFITLEGEEEYEDVYMMCKENQ